MELHLKNKKQLEEQIEAARRSLQELKKRNTLGAVSHNDKDKEITVNVEDLLNDLKKDVLRVYKNCMGDSHADNTKQAEDILRVRID